MRIVLPATFIILASLSITAIAEDSLKTTGGLLLDLGLVKIADQRANLSQVAPPVVVDKTEYTHTHPKHDLTDETEHRHVRGNRPHNHKHSK